MDWTTDPGESTAIAEIVRRSKQFGFQRPPFELAMDITAAHKSCPLDLDRLAEADDADFKHDVHGIVANLNRETGLLENGFRPRFAQE